MRSFPLLILLSSMAWASPSAASELVTQTSGLAVEEQFYLYHKTLSTAASRVLTRTNYHAPQRLDRQPRFEARRSNPQLNGSQLHQFAQQYWGGRSEDLRQALNRLRLLRLTLETILHAEGVPIELIAVVLIESAVQPRAQSHREARGLWQLIPTTARRYGLRVNQGRDDRLDTEKATRAAAGYLRDLHLRFGDWLLALAAYNTGEQAVERAIALAGHADFWSLSTKKLLPAETRDYVPAVLAAVELLGGSSAITLQVDTRARSIELQAWYAQSGANN